MPADFSYEHTTPENVRSAADTAAEAIRYINRTTISVDSGGLEQPSDVDAILASLEILAERIPQALTQLSAWLVRECKANRIRVADAPATHSPSVEAQAVAMVRRYLNDAARDCNDGLRVALHDARQITAVLIGVPDEEGQRADG